MKGSERFAEAIIKILELEDVKYIFGHPGEQILPIYEAIRNSKIEHVLMRHEQGAAHAADAYARVSGKFGVCIATAGPGALNLAMGVATAYKDSVPLLILTGDVPTYLRGDDVFQEIDVREVFAPITISSYSIKTPEEGILKLKKAIEMFNSGKKGPIHLILPSDVLNCEMDASLIYSEIDTYPEIKDSNLDNNVIEALKLIHNAKKPLILAGNGIFWSKSSDKLLKFVENHNVPVTTTYPARGVFPDYNPLYLGMIGIRGTESANFAGKNADLIITLGSRLSERTRAGLGKARTIQVNLDKKSLKGDINILQDVGVFLDSMMDLEVVDREKWLIELEKYSKKYKINTDYDDIPIKPQTAIKEILDAAKDSIIVNDAGSHTTWVTLLQRIKKPGLFISSGGFAPMGYALPAAVGASLAEPEKPVVVIVGDGGFQMTVQELATIMQRNLPVIICIINNSSLGIIKQWQKMNYGDTYQVELENPDFIKLAAAYGINSKRVDSPGEVYRTVFKALNLRKPYLIEVIVDENEEIPLPHEMNNFLNEVRLDMD
ncbi:MAG: thiamine pyrophosphate-binding protein [Methanobacterium sp.]|nr:thiamine pyrophosphate-binding protein [Methanobacterium sp.]